MLREHLYRELTKGAYSPDERKQWADRLGRLLDGPVKAEVGCHLIDVRLGVDASTLRDRTVVAKDGEESVATRVRELNEELILARNALRVADWRGERRRSVAVRGRRECEGRANGRRLGCVGWAGTDGDWWWR